LGFDAEWNARQEKAGHRRARGDDSRRDRVDRVEHDRPPQAQNGKYAVEALYGHKNGVALPDWRANSALVLPRRDSGRIRD